MFCRWHHQQLTIKLPLELSTILEIYLAVGHKVMCTQGGGVNTQFVFMDKKGSPMADSQSMTVFWQDLLRKVGCRVIFPPHRLRDIFVDERRSQGAAAGPLDH